MNEDRGKRRMSEEHVKRIVEIVVDIENMAFDKGWDDQDLAEACWEIWDGKASEEARRE